MKKRERGLEFSLHDEQLSPVFVLSVPRSSLRPIYTSPLVRRDSNPKVPRRKLRVISFARKAKQVCARRTTVWDAADQEQDADDKETMLTQRRPGSEELRISCKVAKMRTSSDNTLTTTTILCNDSYVHLLSH